MNILFVCTANICRSFMAERILKGKLEGKKSRIEKVSSAGISAVVEGMAGDPKAAQILAEKGFDGQGHKSRLLTADMVDKSDKIIVMENIHREDIIGKYPAAEGKIYLLKTFWDSVSDEGIKDPYGLSNYHYRLCFAEIYMAIEGLVRKCI